MMTYVIVMRMLVIAAALAATATACSQPASASAIVAAETPAAGDIPDTQAFVRFAGPGYTVLVPEGWARSRHGLAVAFRSNANSETIDVRPAKPGSDLRKLVGATAAKQMMVRTREQLGGAPATIVNFRSQSTADPVTGKRVALDNTAYVSSAHAGRVVILVLSAPAGADNADQWKKIAGSFRWT